MRAGWRGAVRKLWHGWAIEVLSGNTKVGLDCREVDDIVKCSLDEFRIYKNDLQVLENTEIVSRCRHFLITGIL